MRERFNAFRSTHEMRLGVVVLFTAIVFAVVSPGFRSWGNMRDLLESQAVLAIMAAGLLVVLIAGGIDVSFAAIAAVSQYLTVGFIVRWGGNWPGVLLLAVAIGMVFGVVNALLIHGLKAPPVIVTIATMTFYFSGLMAVTKGAPLYDLPDWFTVKTPIFFLPRAILVAGIVLGATGFLLRRVSLGRQIFALGGNPEAARRVGCNVAGLQCFVYGFSGAMAAVAGLVQAHRVEEVAPNAFIGRELDVLAAVVLGGASLMGGVGTVSGTMLGLMLLAILRNGLTLLGVSSYWFGAVTGLVILASVSGGVLAQRLQARRRGARATA